MAPTQPVGQPPIQARPPVQAGTQQASGTATRREEPATSRSRQELLEEKHDVAAEPKEVTPRQPSAEEEEKYSPPLAPNELCPRKPSGRLGRVINVITNSFAVRLACKEVYMYLCTFDPEIPPEKVGERRAVLRRFSRQLRDTAGDGYAFLDAHSSCELPRMLCLLSCCRSRCNGWHVCFLLLLFLLSCNHMSWSLLLVLVLLFLVCSSSASNMHVTVVLLPCIVSQPTSVLSLFRWCFDGANVIAIRRLPGELRLESGELAITVRSAMPSIAICPHIPFVFGFPCCQLWNGGSEALFPFYVDTSCSPWARSPINTPCLSSTAAFGCALQFFSVCHTLPHIAPVVHTHPLTYFACLCSLPSLSSLSPAPSPPLSTVDPR